MDNELLKFEPTYKPSLFERFIVGSFKIVNKFVPWHKLPSILGALNLEALRIELRQNNLQDGYASSTSQGNAIDEPLTDKRFKDFRNSDGKFNSAELPLMGCAGTRFGRNFPRQYTSKPTETEMMTPNPRMLSDIFMTRKEFIPATTLNLLAAAWIQFQTHDWFVHENSDEVYDIPLPKDDKWPHGDLKLFQTKPDDILHPSDEKCPGYKNKNTAWWDLSQIYGSNEAITQNLRTTSGDGKLLLTKEGKEQFLPRDTNGVVITGFNDNWWIGLEILATMFALEHNSICDMLKTYYPEMSGDQIFDQARLINCALSAKIHTIEWTPAILGHPALQIGMNANWWGVAGETVNKIIGRISKSEAISGIPGSGVDHFGVPYSLTEEFVSVYRMHSLIPDNIAFFNATNGEHECTIPVDQTLFDKSQDLLDGGLSFADAFYSFGVNYPGAITNFNYPAFLQNLTTPDGQHRDLGTVDLLRDRERGVPRYCAFRRLLHMEAPTTFEELTGGDETLAQQLSDAYNGDLEAVDTLIGCHSEPLPKGFGFSDTAFRIFILMASRRLKSDRFIAGQWNDETYSKEGMKWVQNTSMKDILGRHFPELRETLEGSGNAFAPWMKMEKTWEYGGVETNKPRAG